MSEKTEQIARIQVQIEVVEHNLDKLQALELTPEQMRDLLHSFKLACAGFKDCLEDLAAYVGQYEQKR